MGYYATQLSPKDYNRINEINYGTLSNLQTNYAKRIAKHYSVDYAKLEQAFITVFGRDWHETPYKKLQQLAKALPKLELSQSELRMYTPHDISTRAQNDYRTKYYMLNDTYAYRRAVRIFGKTNIKKCYSENRRGYAEELAKAVLGYRMVSEVEGRVMAKAMKTRIPTLANVISVYKSYTTTYYDKTPLELLPEEVRYDVMRLAKTAAVKQCLRDYTRPDWLTMATRMVDAISRMAAHIRTYDEDTRSCLEAKDKLSKMLADMYAMIELDNDLATVGLEIDKCAATISTLPRSCNNTKIDPKLLRAVKATLSTNYDTKEKRDVLTTISNKLLREYDYDKRKYWLPVITFKPTEN